MFGTQCIINHHSLEKRMYLEWVWRTHSSSQSPTLGHPSTWIKVSGHSPTNRDLSSIQTRSKAWLIQLMKAQQNAFRFWLLLTWTAQGRVANGASSPCPSPLYCNGRGRWLRVSGDTPLLRSPLVRHQNLGGHKKLSHDSLLGAGR